MQPFPYSVGRPKEEESKELGIASLHGNAPPIRSCRGKAQPSPYSAESLGIPSAKATPVIPIPVVSKGKKKIEGYTAYAKTIYNPVCSYYLPQNKIYTDEEEWTTDPAFIKRDNPYIDKEFQALPVPTKNPYKISRSLKIHPKEFETELFVDGCGHDDITQGALGDCWLLSALVVLAVMRPKLIVKIFHPKCRAQQADGHYLLRLYINGKREEISVDDRFPVSRISKKPLFCQMSVDPILKKKEIWAMLIEKGMGKGYGGYESLIGGTVDMAFTDLTGGGSIMYDLGDPETERKYKRGSLWQEMCHYAESGYLMGAGSTHGEGREEINDGGIVQGHAYAILDCVLFAPGGASPVPLVQLKNPWGKTEWKGDWSDGSPLWNLGGVDVRRELEVVQGERKLLSGCDPDEYKHIPIENKDDGIFWMTFQDFMLQFSSLYACKIFDHTWALDLFSDSWGEGRDGGCSNYDTVMQNPHYLVTLTAPTTLFIMLIQVVPPHADHDNNPGIGFDVYINEGKLIGQNKHFPKVVASNAGTLYIIYIYIYRRIQYFKTNIN